MSREPNAGSSTTRIGFGNTSPGSTWRGRIFILIADEVAFAALRARLKAEGFDGQADQADLERILYDQLPPDIASARRRQTLQALLNCTRRSLLPDPEVDDQQRAAWADEIARLG
ncbi:MAG: hypothetical protein AAF916_07875 [Planctomycetota bacterium]